MLEAWRRRRRQFKTSPVGQKLEADLNATQAMISGFDLATYQKSHVVLVGCGGIGSQVAHALVRKGIGHITLIDDDRVELKNCTRQLFGRDDVGGFKAVRLGANLAAEGLFKTKIVSYPRRLLELVDRGWEVPRNALFIGGVDNNPSRRALAELSTANNFSCIHAAVSGDGNRAYVMVQKTGKACWGCAFPHYVNDRVYPCNVPGIVDVLQVVAGHIVFASDSLICSRHREWNVKEITLDGSMPDRAKVTEARSDCPVCGGYTRDKTETELI